MTPWHDAESLAMRAMLSAERAVASGDQRMLLRAIEDLRSAIEVRPDEAGWVAALARALEASGDVNAALLAYTDARRLDGDDPELTFRHAALLRLANSPSHALDLLTDLIAHHPEFEPAYCLKAQLHAEQGEHELVDETYYLARTVTEECERCDFAAGFSLVARARETGDAKSARLAVRLLSRLAGETEHGIPRAQIHTLLARAWRCQGQSAAACEQYELALRHVTETEPPSAGELHLELARYYAELRNEAGALAHLQEAVRADADDAVAALAYAEALLKRGDTGLAEEAAERARRLDPTMPGAGLILARCAVARGDRRSARTCAERDLRLSPSDERLLLELGLVAEDARSPRLAMRAYRRLVQIAPGRKEGWQNLALLYFRKRCYALGLEATYQALRLSPHDPACLHNLALALGRMGRLDEACVVAREGARRHPQDKPLRHLLRRMSLVRWVRGFGRRRA